MNFLDRFKKKIDVHPACIIRVGPDNKTVSYLTQQSASTTVTPPTGDGVYTADGSPPIGTFKWKKTNLTWAVSMVQNGVLADIPNTHDIAVAIALAFTTISLDCPLKFQQVPFTGPDCADITIKFDDGKDPYFVSDPSAMAYTYYAGTKPSGVFSSVYNLKYLWALTNGGLLVNGYSPYDINETFLHELRHSIGCVHTQSVNDIMNPFYHEQRIPSAMDIYQEQFMYGQRTPPVNPIEKTAFYTGYKNNLEFSKP